MGSDVALINGACPRAPCYRRARNRSRNDTVPREDQLEILEILIMRTLLLSVCVGSVLAGAAIQYSKRTYTRYIRGDRMLA
jgi:hypothetical protein